MFDAARRRLLVYWLLLACTPRPVAAQPRKSARIGYLDPGTITSVAPLLKAFRDGLAEHGWVEGHNVTLETRAADGAYERLPALVAELIQQKVDVIVTSGTPAAIAAKRGTTTIPIVAGRVADPVASGVVASLARPGGNVTGWTHQGLELRVKYLDLLKEAVPSATRMGVLWNPQNPIHQPSLKLAEGAAHTLVVEMHSVGVARPADIDGAFAALTHARVQALAVFADGMFLAQADRIIKLAAVTRIPALYGMTELVRSGGLMGYGVNLPQMYRRGAMYVDRILRGADPASMPVEQPTQFEFVINARTARALGVALSPSLLARADHVIQ